MKKVTVNFHYKTFVYSPVPGFDAYRIHLFDEQGVEIGRFIINGMELEELKKKLLVKVN